MNGFVYGDIVMVRDPAGGHKLLHYLRENGRGVELAVDIPNSRLEPSDERWCFYGRVVHKRSDIVACIGHRDGYSVTLFDKQLPEVQKGAEPRREAA